MSTNNGILKKLSLATMATIVTIIGGCLTIAVFVFPRLQPEPPPAAMRATLSGVTMEHNISLNDYLVENATTWKMNIADYAPEELKLVGGVVGFTTEITGFKGRNCTLQWSLYNADTRSRAPGMTAKTWGTLKPEAAVDSISEEIWVPYPNTVGNYFIRLQIVDDKGIGLATADSEVFHVNG